jgi:hypothetical protein
MAFVESRNATGSFPPSVFIDQILPGATVHANYVPWRVVGSLYDTYAYELGKQPILRMPGRLERDMVGSCEP